LQKFFNESIDPISFLDIFEEESHLHINALIFNGLFFSEGRNKLNEQMISLLIDNFNQVKTLHDKMQDIEIIDDNFELDLFTIINGNSNKTELLSPKQLELEVFSAIKYIKNEKGNINKEDS